MKKNIIHLLCLCFTVSALAQGNVYKQEASKWEGLAMTPPMGWNSWNTFETKIDEKLVKETADLMVATGMKDAGYTYIVLDDGWMTRERDSNGNLVPDPEKFPGGMKALVDYVHAKGLKFGLYNCAGTKTCAGYPGTRGYEYQDARFYASLNIDFLKYDWCNTQGINSKEAYTTMSNALKAAGKPIVFSLCEWGDTNPWEWGEPVGNLWRISGDIYPCFDCEFKHEEGNWSSWGFMKIIEMRKGIRQHSGPDHWNDFDMLEVGNGMTQAEDRSHFSMWAMVASPLIAGNDFRSMSKETLALLTNKDIIAINQDKMGVQGFKHAVQDGLETWAKPLANGDWAIAFLNRSDVEQKIHFDWAKNEIKDDFTKATTGFATTTYAIKDVWKDKQAGTTKKAFKGTVASHDIVVLRLTKNSQ